MFTILKKILKFIMNGLEISYGIKDVDGNYINEFENTQLDEQQFNYNNMIPIAKL